MLFFSYAITLAAGRFFCKSEIFAISKIGAGKRPAV